MEDSNSLAQTVWYHTKKAEQKSVKNRNETAKKYEKCLGS